MIISYPGSADMNNVLLIIVTGKLTVNMLCCKSDCQRNILAVVKSAAKGTIIEPVVATICNLYPNIQPFV